MTTIFKPSPGLTERTWPSIILSPISVTGHLVTVSSTLGLKVKMKVTLSKPGVIEEQFEIKRVYDALTIMVGPIGQNIKKGSDAVKFDGGTLYADEQSRNVLGDAPIIRAVYEEEPTIAIRTVSVTPTGSMVGTPEAELGTIPPDAHFLYGCAYETTSIREYAPSKKVYSGNIDVSIGGSSVEVDAVIPWMTIGETFLAMSVDGFGTVLALEQFEITGITGNVLSVSPAPTANYTGLGRIDGSIGDTVKVTNFEYGNAYEVVKIYTSFDVVNNTDIIKHLR